MKKKLIAITLTAMITIGALAGCGNTTGNTANSNTTGAANNAAEHTSQNAVESAAANTGKQTTDNSGTNTADIGSDTASQIALEAAGFTEADVTNLRVKTDRDDGRTVYEVEFWNDNTEYDYEILASTGEILSYDQDVKKSQFGAQNNQSGQNSSQNAQTGQNNTQISLEDAKKLALDRVPGATEQNMKIELDYDDGYYKYEGEIIYDQKEYEFEIDADTGTFLEWSEERW